VVRSKAALLGHRQLHVRDAFSERLERWQFALHQERSVVHLGAAITQDRSSLLTRSGDRSRSGNGLFLVQGHRRRCALKRRRFGRFHWRRNRRQRGRGGDRRRVGAVILALARIADTTLAVTLGERVFTTHAHTTMRAWANVYRLETAHSGNVHLDLTLQLLLSSNVSRVLLTRDTTLAKS